jgi:hypothetical protein
MAVGRGGLIKILAIHGTAGQGVGIWSYNQPQDAMS